MMTNNDYAIEQDASDLLAKYKQHFVIPDDDLIYLDGNSLGRLPKATLAKADTLIQQQWADRLIRSWNEGWFEAPKRIGAKIAQLIGAKPHEVIVADSTSINLFKLVVAALRYQTKRSGIVTDDLNFPSDLYVMQGAIDILDKNHAMQLIASEDGVYAPVEKIKAALNESTALLSLTHTVFKSGYTYDMADLTAAAHSVGALALWDLSHSVGSVDIDLNKAKADLAIGCSYKYLNGGPGAPAFIYIREDLQDKLINPIPGWMGKKNLFDFALSYEADNSLQSFLTGTPTVASLELMEPGIDLLIEVGMKAIREKSVKQTSFLIKLYEEKLAQYGFSLKTPREAQWRGSHVSFGHPQGLGIDLAMIKEKNIIPDFRPPDNIRLGIAPLYISFNDIYTAVNRIEDIMQTKLYEKYAEASVVVT